MKILNLYNTFNKSKVKSHKNHTTSNDSDFTSIFLSFLHSDSTITDENLKTAFKRVEEKFNKKTECLNVKFFINFYYDKKGRPNEHYYEIMEFWDVFKEFYTYEHDRYPLIQYCLILEDLKSFK